MILPAPPKWQAPLGFLVGQLSTKQRGPAPDRYGERVRSASLLCPTLFPIVFTASVGRALKQIASWKLERGTHVGTLEAMMGSIGIRGATNSIYAEGFSFPGLSTHPGLVLFSIGRAVNLVESPVQICYT